MKLFAKSIILLLAPSFIGILPANAQTDDERVFGLTATRYDMPHLCKVCTSDMLDRDSVELPYVFATMEGWMSVVFDSTNTHRRSLWKMKKEGDLNYIYGLLMLELRLTELYGKHEGWTEGEVSILVWEQGDIITALYTSLPTKEVVVTSFYKSDKYLLPDMDSPSMPRLLPQREGEG